MISIYRALLISLKFHLLGGLVLGFMYPVVIVWLASMGWPYQAHGSLITKQGVPIASALVGQEFREPQFFHARPSLAGLGYDARASQGSNLGPSHPKLILRIKELAESYRNENKLSSNQLIPLDAVTASASGLDPHISLVNASLQAPRVAKARGLSLERVLALVAAAEERSWLRPHSDALVAVVPLNLSLELEQTGAAQTLSPKP